MNSGASLTARCAVTIISTIREWFRFWRQNLAVNRKLFKRLTNKIFWSITNGDGETESGHIMTPRLVFSEHFKGYLPVSSVWEPDIRVALWPMTMQRVTTSWMCTWPMRGSTELRVGWCHCVSWFLTTGWGWLVSVLSTFMYGDWILHNEESFEGWLSAKSLLFACQKSVRGKKSERELHNIWLSLSVIY